MTREILVGFVATGILLCGAVVGAVVALLYECVTTPRHEREREKRAIGEWLAKERSDREQE